MVEPAALILTLYHSGVDEILALKILNTLKVSEAWEMAQQTFQGWALPSLPGKKARWRRAPKTVICHPQGSGFAHLKQKCGRSSSTLSGNQSLIYEMPRTCACHPPNPNHGWR